MNTDYLNMVKIKDLLNNDIAAGFINWLKMSEKIHACLSMVDNKFKVLRDGDKKVADMQFSDALTFKVNKNNESFCYKIVSPRFINGELYCKSLIIGRYDLKGVPYF